MTWIVGHNAGMESPIYLDYNATTPIAPEVIDAMLPALREAWGNPSSTHVYGRQARRAVEVAQANLATERARHDAAERTAELARVAFLQGTGTSFDLVETQRSLREAEIDVAVAEYELTDSELAALLKLADCAL